MRLLVDAQCIQSSSSKRGIGRYALSLTRGLVQEAGSHQVEVLLNGGDDPARLMRAREALEEFLRPSSIHVFDAAWPWTPPYDDARRPAAQAAYTAAVRSLAPDAVLIGSLFEPDGENVLAVRPTAADPPTAVVLYDLIPAMDPGTYLLGPGGRSYWRRFEDLRRCDAVLAISRYSGAQALQLLGPRCPPVTPVWGGPYPSGAFPAFEQQSDDAPNLTLPEDFVLSVGGDHPRKNLDRLISAWAGVPADLRQATPLVVACRLNPGTVRRLRRLARRGGIRQGELLLTGGVSERTLGDLYDRARAFVFPSTEEGLGMPPLEAMAAGCPTVLARGSSLSELSDEPDSFFDGRDVASMSASITAALADDAFRERLVIAGAASSERFTWRHAAQLAWAALDGLPRVSASRPRAPQSAVRVSDSSAVELLAQSPAPVLLDVPFADEMPGELGLPVLVRARLAPATALIAPTQELASAAARAGLVDQPVLSSEADLERAAQHDFHAAYAESLAHAGPIDGPLVSAVVAAATRTARWALERPRPVWLLLTEEPVPTELVDAGATAGVDLVVALSKGAILAASVDVVLVPASGFRMVEQTLAHARSHGTLVVALHEADATSTTSSWCRDVAVHGPVLAAATWRASVWPHAGVWGRTTGWPWCGA